jgi:beta-lactamase class A
MNLALGGILPRIADFRKAHPGSEVWLSAKNLDTGARFALGEHAKVRTASTIKLPILCAAYRLAAESKLPMDEKLVMRAEDVVSGSGIIREFSPGTQFTVRDLLHVMIVVSDNTATNLILDRISADYVNACMDDWGYRATRSMRKVRGDGNQLKEASGFSKAGLMEENRRFGLGSSTPAEMVSLLERIEKGEIVSAAASKEMIAILKRQQYKDGIGRRMDGTMPVASKSGALDALRSDVGIVYSPGGRIAIAATVDGMPKVDYGPDNVGNLLIADLTDLLIAGLGRTQS